VPIIQVNMLEGRTTEQKRKLVAGITTAVIAALGVQPEQVRVMINELGEDDYAIGGKTAAERGMTAAKK
jgi:4-oxalocrotonate tautomerase